MLPSVTTHSSFTKSVMMSCQKWKFFLEPEVKSQWKILAGYLTISTNVSWKIKYHVTAYFLSNKLTCIIAAVKYAW